MRCDGRTFTETNGNIVSGKADRAVNRGPNTEQINISRNSFVFSDRLGARQQMHQTLSGLLQPAIVLELWPLSWTRSWGAAVLGPEGKRPRVWAFSPAIAHHEISFVMFLAEPSTLMKLSLPLSLTSWKHRGDNLPSMNLVWMGGHQRASPRSHVLVQLMDWLCKVNSSNPWQWCTAVIAKRLFLTLTQSIIVHHTGLVQVTCGPWGI